MPDNIPAHQATLRQVELSVGRPQTLDGNVHQVDHVPNVPIATLWRQAIGRDHSRATLRSEPTTR